MGPIIGLAPYRGSQQAHSVAQGRAKVGAVQPYHWIHQSLEESHVTGVFTY